VSVTMYSPSGSLVCWRICKGGACSKVRLTPPRGSWSPCCLQDAAKRVAFGNTEPTGNIRVWSRGRARISCPPKKTAPSTNTARVANRRVELPRVVGALPINARPFWALSARQQERLPNARARCRPSPLSQPALHAAASCSDRACGSGLPDAALSRRAN